MHVQIKQEDEGVDGPSSEGLISPSNGVHAVNSADKTVIDISVSYSFHDTATVALHEPGHEEIDGVLNQTVDFFSEVLFEELADSRSIKSINLVATSVEYNEENKFPVVVYAQLEVNLNDESSAVVIQRPSAEQIVAILETANMQDYVSYYVWFSEPVGSIFFAANQAVVETYSPSSGAATSETAAAAAAVPDGLTTNSAPEPPTLHTVSTDLTAMFAFFEVPERSASESELESLTSETTSFLTAVVEKVYNDLVRLDLEITRAGLAEAAKDVWVVSWKISGAFYVLDGTAMTRTSEHLSNIVESSDVEDYLHNHVWKTVPLGGNVFFGASAVQFEAASSSGGADSTFVVGSNTSIGSSNGDVVGRSSNEVVIRCSIHYGFLEDIVISRKPTSSEEDEIEFETSLFFNKVFRRHFNDDSFTQLTATVEDVTLLKDGDVLPVVISYTLMISFQNADSVPEVEEMYAVMSDADLEEYIEDYVWNVAGDSMFFDTQRVSIQAVI